MIDLLLVVLGSLVGAPLRYLLDRQIQSSHERVFPFGTMTVNVVGSFLLGAVTGLAASAALSAPWVVALGVGLLGSFTTFSTYVWETLVLLQERSYVAALANAIGSIGLGLVAAYAGFAIV